MSIAYIGLGSNLDEPRQQLVTALAALRALPQSQVLADSGLFQSKAMTLADDDEPQPDYLNAVVKLETALAPLALLDALQSIESSQGRVRDRRWGARTLDLDILMYDELQYSDERLTLPHPGIAQRDFVLYPLQKIDNEITIPGQGNLNQLIENISNHNLQYLGAIA